MSEKMKPPRGEPWGIKPEERLKVQVLEGADNKLDLAKLEDVLRRQLIIPLYQRPYAWEAEDIKEIFQTISHTEENKENICFFGSIILSRKSNGFGQEEYYIIDGQQRLSSFLFVLRVVLDSLSHLSEKLASLPSLTEGQIEKKLQLNEKKNSLKKIIQTVRLRREKPLEGNDEQSILDFIKNSGDYNKLPSRLEEIIEAVYFESPVCSKDDFSDPKDNQFFEEVDKVLEFLDFILNKIKFCLICITGENSEDFAINLFNTLNTTGQPLTAFEVLKSELHTIDSKLSKKIDQMQSEIIDKYRAQRKKIVTHTGKLLLYLPLYRGDFKEGNYTLSDKKFKDQRGYLKNVLKEETAAQLVKDLETVNNFYSKYWLDPKSAQELFKKGDERVCFQFLSELKHERVLPVLIRFYENNKEELSKSAKSCAAFSSLWRAFHDGGTSGIDKAYEDISKLPGKTKNLSQLNQELKKLFLKKISADDMEEAKSKWTQKMKTSPVYKNRRLCKFLLFLAYNQRHFDPERRKLKKGSGIDIFNIHYWTHEDYKTIEHIIPKSDRGFFGHIHTLGNLTILPIALNSFLGDKPFSDKLEQYRKFCSTENKDKYHYLPLIQHIASYERFRKEEIEKRSKILSEFIWQELAEGWLGWE